MIAFKKKLSIIIMLLLQSVKLIHSFKSTDICYKQYECKNHFVNCTFLNCTGLLSYDCNRLECALDAATCQEYQWGVDEIFKRKHLKLDRARTVSLMQGISFLTKRLNNLDKMLKNIKLCS